VRDGVVVAEQHRAEVELDAVRVAVEAFEAAVLCGLPGQIRSGTMP
jgi:hypothetical protein